MCCRAIALALLAVLPACADSRFPITIVPRPEVAPGKGQCDIRLEIDNEVQVTIRRDQVLIKTVSGEDARDDGSDCNVPLPAHDLQNFAVQPVDNRSEFHVLERPSARNNYALVLRIVDAAAGFGRYHFRLSWDDSPGPSAAERSPHESKSNDNEHPSAPPGFVWNNATNFQGRGSGESVLNESATQKLGDVRVDVDLGGKIVVTFSSQQPRGASTKSHLLVFTGVVMAREPSRIRASMMTEDQRLHGTMTISVGDANKVNSITMNATDGQDHLHLTWDRR
jgi:hypothetical protein